MAIQVPALSLGHQTINVNIDKLPDSCPKCHKHIIPMWRSADYVQRRPLSFIQIPMRCVNNDCQELFIAKYVVQPSSGDANFYDTEPVYPQLWACPDSVADLSPSFVAIMTQVSAAESCSLDQLVGIGLRKAIEFLIKDYAISVSVPEAKSAIERSTLSQCIDACVEDGNVKKCAKRATWLGNDETHYIRKWETKDITDLKTLVRLTTIWIESVLLTAQYNEEMPDTK